MPPELLYSWPCEMCEATVADATALTLYFSARVEVAGTASLIPLVETAYVNKSYENTSGTGNESYTYTYYVVESQLVLNARVELFACGSTCATGAVLRYLTVANGTDTGLPSVSVPLGNMQPGRYQV